MMFGLLSYLRDFANNDAVGGGADEDTHITSSPAPPPTAAPAPHPRRGSLPAIVSNTVARLYQMK